MAFSKTKPEPVLAGLHLELDDAVVAGAAGLLDVAPLHRRTGLRDRLLVGDLRLADVRVDLELAQQAVGDDLEVQLAHAGDDRLAGLLVDGDAEGRILLGEALEGLASLSMSALVLGSMAIEMTGSGSR